MNDWVRVGIVLGLLGVLITAVWLTWPGGKQPLVAESVEDIDPNNRIRMLPYRPQWSPDG